MNLPKINVSSRILRRYVIVALLSLIYCVNIVAPAVTYSISDAEYASLVNDSTFYDPLSSEACSLDGVVSNIGLPKGSKIYMLGDSITVLSKTALAAAYATAGYQVTGINADGGRAISKDTGGTQPTGLQAVIDDSTLIQGSDAVVVALGTNSGTEDLNVQIPALVKLIREQKSGVPIYWVNLFYTAPSRDARNAIITANATAADGTRVYNIIDMTKTAIELEPTDGTHPTTVGQPQFAQAVINGLVTSSSGSSSTVNSTITFGEGVWTTGSGIYQSGLQPPYSIEQWAISVLKNISLKSGLPESTMVTQQKTLALVAWAHAEGGGVDGHNGDFNPLNTKGGSGELGGVNQGNASTDSNSNGFPTFDKGVEGITRGLFNRYQTRVGSTLIKPVMTPEELIEAVAGDFYSTTGSNSINRLEAQYPGNKAWAMLSVTGFNYGGGIGDRAEYLDDMLGALEVVRGNYAKYAGKLLNGSVGTPAPLVFSATGATGASVSAGGACGISQPAAGKASEYIKDCGVNGGNANIACVAINELVGVPYSQASRAAATDPTPKFLDCSALTGMAVFRAFGTDLGGICSADYLSNRNFETIDIQSIQPGDFIGRGASCAGTGGSGHIAIVVSYDRATKKLITIESSSENYPSGLRGIGGEGGYNVGLAVDGNGTYEWAVRYIGPKNLDVGVHD